MHAAILTIHLLLALALILVVLLQRSEGGGLGIGGGGGIMTSRGAATALSKVTWMIGIAFVATSLTLTIIAARDAGGGSLVDTIMPPGEQADTGPAPAVPGLGGDLLPQHDEDQRQRQQQVDGQDGGMHGGRSRGARISRLPSRSQRGCRWGNPSTRTREVGYGAQCLSAQIRGSGVRAESNVGRVQLVPL